MVKIMLNWPFGTSWGPFRTTSGQWQSRNRLVRLSGCTMAPAAFWKSLFGTPRRFLMACPLMSYMFFVHIIIIGPKLDYCSPIDCQWLTYWLKLLYTLLFPLSKRIAFWRDTGGDYHHLWPPHKKKVRNKLFLISIHSYLLTWQDVLIVWFICTT